MKRILRVALLLMACSQAAEGHQRSLSYSRWTIDAEVARVEVRITDLELTRFPDGAFQPAYFSSRLLLLDGDEPLAAGPVARIARSAPGWAVFRWEVPIADAESLTIHSDVFLDITSTHQHFARVHFASRPNTEASERLLTENRRSWTLGRQSNRIGFGEYFALGVRHILGGWDHLSFLLVLLLPALAMRDAVALITGFTIAHSVTLAVAALGLFRPEGRVVEVYIAFSIALIAVENFWWSAGRDRAMPTLLAIGLLGAGVASLGGRGLMPPVAWAGLVLFTFAYFTMLQESTAPFRLRGIVTLAFGLVHGFGFAGVLMDIGLPPERAARSLLGFNLGVEAGQLLVLAACWPIVSWVRQRSQDVRFPRPVELGSAAALCMAVFWLVSRNWA